MRIPVSKSLLDWAIQRSRVGAEINDRFPKLEQWRSGLSQPTLRQLEKFATATSTPMGYFFLSKPPEESLDLPDFRTINDAAISRPSSNLLETVNIMKRRQVWMREYLIKQGHQRLSFVGSCKSNDDSKEIAKVIFGTLSLSESWAAGESSWGAALTALRSKIESVGIMVVINGIVGNNTHRKLDPFEFRGFVLSDEYAPLIFVNGSDAISAQMFTLAHEMVHIWVGSSGIFDLQNLEPADDKTEKLCNQAAAEFLLPEKKLRAIWQGKGATGQTFDELARQFKVSQIVVARRALDLALITKAEFLAFYREHQFEHKKAQDIESSGGDFYRTQNTRIGKLFGSTVVQAAKEGLLLYRDAYQLTGLYGDTFEKFAESIGS